MRNFDIFNLNLFNEKVYLEKNRMKNHDANIILQNEQLIYSSEKATEKQFNIEAINLYKNFQTKIKELLDILKIGKNDLEKAFIIEYLFHNNYFSPLKENNDKLNYYLGLNILLGHNNHKNISEFYNDLFKDSYEYPLEYYAYASNKEKSHKSKVREPNTVINLADLNGVLYGIDLLTKSIYQFNDSFSMELVDNEKEEYLRYKPYFELLKKYKTLDYLNSYLYLFQDSSKYNLLLDQDDFNKMRERIYEWLNERKGILTNFKKETTPIIEEVNEKMLIKK